MAAPSLLGPFAKHVTSDLDLSVEALTRLLDLAAQVKRAPQRFAQSLAGRYLSLLFEKPSLRTRLTFELAIKQLGGDAVTCVGPVGEGEPVKDVARNLDRWTHGIVARVFRQTTVDELAQWASVPVINALSDMFHPCQALADVQTLKERFGRWGSAGSRFRRARGLYRRVGQHGPGRRGRAPAAGVCALSSRRSVVRPGASGCHLHALSSRPPRTGSKRCGHGIGALRDFRSS